VGVESADMADGGESGGRVVRCRLIWNNAMVDFEQRVSRDSFPTFAHSRRNTGVAGFLGMGVDGV